MVQLETSDFHRNVLTHPFSGEMMFLSALGQGILVINSQRVAIDLLEKRSNIYSDRPDFISAGRFLTQNLSFILTRYGDLYVVGYSLSYSGAHSA